ncbi:hypothetical protein MKX08_003437 [Trichoderma sp. CBMAI-0020]|nr:hypothetical protein MKX08_003437 [Trichoderma sp. CBMAI-0020]
MTKDLQELASMRKIFGRRGGWSARGLLEARADQPLLCLFWSALTVFEPPPQGWSIPDIDPDIFIILIKWVCAASGFRGTESKLNLIKLCYAFHLAKKWWMMQD